MGEFKKLGTMLDAARELPPPLESPQAGTSSPPAKISGVPPRRIGDTFETFDLAKNPKMLPAYDQARAVAEGRAWCAVLAGDPGNGKTHLAVAAMHRYGLLRSMFWKVPDYLDWLKRMAFGDDARISIDTLTRAYMTQDILLVLDDLGTENRTGWAEEQLYRVLDARYDNELPTIITTNQPRDRIDGRLLSRYSEGLVVCKGDDVRRRTR